MTLKRVILWRNEGREEEGEVRTCAAFDEVVESVSHEVDHVALLQDAALFVKRSACCFV